MTLKTSKKKLITSLILFIIGLVALAVFIGVAVISSSKQAGEFNAWWLMPICACVYSAFMIASLILNHSYRKYSISAGALSTTLYVFQFIFLLPYIIFGIIMFVYILLHGGGISGGENLKKIKLVDEDGKEYILTQTAEGSNEYRDQEGEIWVTRDGGATFECITKIRVKDKDGNKHELTPNANYYGSDCTDENGDAWQTHDSGDSYERKPKVTDDDGRECVLTRSSANSNYYTDQYGRSWESNVTGDAFELNWRWKDDADKK